MNIDRLLVVLIATAMIPRFARSVESYSYIPAVCDYSGITAFSAGGKPVNFSLLPGFECVQFGVDGRSLFLWDKPRLSGRHNPGQPPLRKVEFNPTRFTPIRGSDRLNEFVVTSFAVSKAEDKIVMSGKRRDSDSCGIFEISIPEGGIRQVIAASDCLSKIAKLGLWNYISLSPDGRQAVAAIGNSDRRDLCIELIDLLRKTATNAGSDFWIGTWSPDGRSVAALGTRRRGDSLYLINPNEPMHQRRLPARSMFAPAWSPDSRYLLLSKTQLRCGISADVDPPQTLGVLEVANQKKSTIWNSQCHVNGGLIGWVNTAVAQ